MSGPLAILIETNTVLVDSCHIDNGIAYDDAQHDNTANFQPSFAPDYYGLLTDDEIWEEDPEQGDSKNASKAQAPSSPPSHLLRNGPIRRNYRDFPVIRAIEHLRKVGNVEYDYYVQSPQGYRTTETDWKWSLYRSDWYYVVTGENTMVLVGRSILKEMGIVEEDLPVPKNEDLEEMHGLPERPIRRQDCHQLEGHSREVCHWPEMTEDPKYIPVLDRSLGESLLDSLI
ncbi:hypothetical protein FRC01_014376, partial [Tulasnella sp. 417]